jgi:hypothetical protein
MLNNYVSHHGKKKDERTSSTFSRPKVILLASLITQLCETMKYSATCLSPLPILNFGDKRIET